MARLPSIQCPRCLKTVAGVEVVDQAPRASTYESCLRRCDDCGLGFSNASTVKNVVPIYRDPFTNIPPELVAGLEGAFATSLNEVSRTKKRGRLVSANSEDHLTWVIFRHLQNIGQLRPALARAGVRFAHDAHDEPTMLLWGSPVPAASVSGRAIRRQMEGIADGLNEKRRRRSEPDVTLDFGASGVVFIEIKLRSRNDDKSADYANWSKYVSSRDAFNSATRVRQSRHYELARNWRLAWDLAGNRPMAVVNLGPNGLFTGTENRRRLDQFRSAWNQTAQRQFIEATWAKFLGRHKDHPEEWLRHYLDERRVLVSKFTGFVKGVPA